MDVSEIYPSKCGGRAPLSVRIVPLVAVHDGEVVAVSGDLQRLVLLLREKGFEPTQVWVRYVAVTPREWAL